MIPYSELLNKFEKLIAVVKDLKERVEELENEKQNKVEDLEEGDFVLFD